MLRLDYISQSSILNVLVQKKTIVLLIKLEKGNNIVNAILFSVGYEVRWGAERLRIVKQY